MEKILRLLKHSFTEGSVQIWRNTFLTLSTLGLGVLIMFLLNILFSVQFLINNEIQNLEQRADFSVYLREDFDAFVFDAMLNDLRDYSVEIELLPLQTSAEVVLPPRVHVTFGNLEQVEPVLQVFKKERYDMVVGEWDFVGEQEFLTIVRRLLRIRQGIDTMSVWLTILFVLGGVLLMVNTFRMAIFARREEISIARMMGADYSFIKGPFVMEGILLALLSVLGAFFLTLIVLQRIKTLPAGDTFLYLWDRVLGMEIALAVLVGAGGALLALRRYFRGKEIW